MEGRILDITDKFPFADVRINKLNTVLELRSKKSEIKVTISKSGISFDKGCFINKRLIDLFLQINGVYNEY